MRYLILLIMFLCAPASAQAWPGYVVSVHDGDSVRVRRADDGQEVRIRIYGVDCPELGQPHGAAARQLARDMLQGREVEVVPAVACGLTTPPSPPGLGVGRVDNN